ncbi:dihydroorotase [candidate division WOR-3 bacterium]|uniref:Dihydroorotase n=1 Tax=candidate division WOR-3 bacterium TaxID=2052148 RepID=A0A937XDL0_UNCW3|nr:dihydroorotase [candidate division WOR-3 bacterium]
MKAETKDRLLLQGGSVVDPLKGSVRRADVLVVGGRIEKVEASIAAGAGTEVLDCRGKHIAPGLVDMHCHLREPGREDEETIASGTAAALAGGFTRVCPMPNTEPAIDTEAQVRFEVRRAAEAGFARLHPIGCCTKGRQGKELAEIGSMVDAGAVAFSDDGSPIDDAQVMRRVLEYCKAFDVPVISHCEVKELVEGVANEGRVSTKLGLKSGPDVAESAQAARDVLLAEFTRARLHIAHVSAKSTVDVIRWAKARSVQVTAETCPHYFVLTEDALTDFDTNCKVNPPLRAEADRRAVIAGLADGTIDAIATDHAPHLKGEKEAEFDAAPPGIIGFETAFSLGYEQLVLGRALPLADYIARLAVAPRRILNLPPAAVAPASEAELVVLDLKAEWKYAADNVRSLSRNSPFLGRVMHGRVSAALLGEKLFRF